MLYQAMGAVSASDFVKRGSVCKPANYSTQATFREMQAQLNRCAQAFGVPKIAVDGDIGTGTLTLLSRLASKMSDTNAMEVALANEASNDCSTVASRAETVLFFAKTVANGKGAPATVASGGGSSSGGSSGNTGIVPPPITGGTSLPGAGGGIAASLSAMSTIEKAGLAVGALALGMALFGKKKRR